MTLSVPAAIWAETQTLRPIVEGCRAQTDHLRRLPDPIVQAFVDRDIYRLLLPVDLGGRGVDPLAQFDLTEEISSYDGWVGWNYAVGMYCRAAGGDALFENQPFERALRDVNTAAGHVVFQRAMMEDCGRVAMGLPSLLPMF